MRYYVGNMGNGCCSGRYKLISGLLFGVSLVSPLGAFAAVWAPQETAVFDLVNMQRGFNNVNHLQQDDRLHTAALGHSQSMADNNFFSHTTLSGSNGATFSGRITDAGYNWTAAGENIAGGQGRDFTSGINQMNATDAARDVMYGTTEFTSINTFFSDNFGISASGWGELGIGVTGEAWDSWQANQAGSGGWMGSSGHRHNILNDMFDDLGVGYVWEPTDMPPILLDGGNTISFPLHTYWTQSFAAGDSVAPVPLPGAFWLLGSGLLSLIYMGRQRRATHRVDDLLA